MIANKNSIISVIIPTYRRPNMLREAIQSVLKQQNCVVEVIVIDDHSCDETASVVKEFPEVRYFENNENYGPGYSRRFGLSQSSGKYVIFLDDDDFYTDTLFFAKATKILEASNECVFVAANAVVSHEYNKTQVEVRLNTSGSISTADYLQGFPFRYKKPHSTFTSVFRKSALVNAGVIDMQMLNDMPLYMRSLTVGGTIFFMEDTIGVYRIHNNNISNAMTWDFIRANLEEKYTIKKQIEQNALFLDTASWWLKQIEITINYFVYGSNPSPRDWQKAKKWCKEHTESTPEIDALFKKNKAYLLDYRKSKFKRNIKRLLRME